MTISVIIPTRNRAEYLQYLLESLLVQSCNKKMFDILIVDNGSTDGTADMVKRYLQRDQPPRMRYFFASKPGLHVGRHVGATHAEGEILCFLDDDVIVSPVWLGAVYLAFQEPNVALVGGKILPRWNSNVPDWINLFRVSLPQYDGWTIWQLSLLDLGNVSKTIPAQYVYGANFSIRKSVLFECRGFHPDGMPQELIRYRGDGESALALSIEAKGYHVWYKPEAVVYHQIPPERLTVDYFCQRAFNQGVSDSYTEMRRQGGISDPPFLKRCLLRMYYQFHCMTKMSMRAQKERMMLSQVEQAYKQGRAFHRNQVAADKALLEYILQPDYFSEEV